MPFSVLKISNGPDHQIEVAGEFANEEDAHHFADHVIETTDDEFEVLIEAPPSAVRDLHDKHAATLHHR